MWLKGIVHPKITILSIIYSPLRCSKPIRPSFIFRTQICIFLMKSESFLAVCKQRCNWNVQGLETYPCDIRDSAVLLLSYKNKFCARCQRMFTRVPRCMLMHEPVFWRRTQMRCTLFSVRWMHTYALWYSCKRTSKTDTEEIKLLIYFSLRTRTESILIAS